MALVCIPFIDQVDLEVLTAKDIGLQQNTMYLYLAERLWMTEKHVWLI